MSPSHDRSSKTDLDLIYEGSVKRIYRDTTADALLFHFTDDYSVFDWGKMPDTIPDKGLNLTLMGAYFFELFADAGYFKDLKTRRQSDPEWPFAKDIFAGETFAALSKRGMPTHYLGLSDGVKTFSLADLADQNQSERQSKPIYLKVREALVQRPTAHVLSSVERTVYFYPPGKPASGLRLIPLEVVFRLGMPEGSSLLKRVEDIQALSDAKERDSRMTALADGLCIDSEQLQKGAGAFFSRPIVEFYTKLEPQDRHLSQQEALLISGITAEALDKLIELARILALSLYDRFAQNGNVLYDGKFEFVEDLATGEILLADSIGPDELRLIKEHEGLHLSKESLRLHYRDSDWYRELARAKANPLAGFDWKKACQEATGGPRPLPPEVIQATKDIYAGLTRDLMQKMPQRPDRAMRVLQVGGGGREHALAFKMAQSAKVEKVYVAPGNGGAATESKLQNVSINALDVEALVDFSQKEHINLIVIGPETALFTGLADRLRAIGKTVFGPGKDASKLEWSKAYAKKVMREAGLPTAAFALAHDRKSALALLDADPALRVIKLDGLAQGKGVFILECIDDEERQREIAQILDQIDDFYAKNKDQAYCLVLEEMLQGEEISVFCLFDGKNHLLLPQAQDHKRRYDQDKGPNTGGMGAVSPTSKFETQELKSRISEQVIKPLSAYLTEQGIDYRGVIFIGLMIAPDGTPNVLEFNARFGDPETQALMMGLPAKVDLYELLQAVAEGRLDRFDKDAFAQGTLGHKYTVACCLVHQDYPAKSSDGQEIIFGTRINVLQEQGSLKIFHSGTRLDQDTKKLLTAGGRILTVCATGDSPQSAREILYAAIKDCHFKGMAYRKDIGLKQIAEKTVNA